jgi:hypothetical protein
MPCYLRDLSAARGRAKISSSFVVSVGSFPCRCSFKK